MPDDGTQAPTIIRTARQHQRGTTARQHQHGMTARQDQRGTTARCTYDAVEDEAATALDLPCKAKTIVLTHFSIATRSSSSSLFGQSGG